MADLRSSWNAILPVARSVLGLEDDSANGHTNGHTSGHTLDDLAPMDLTILFTDIENYAGAVDTLGDQLSLELVHVHNRLVREALAQHGGHEIKHTGDGIMACFASASRAVATAVDLQLKTDRYNVATAKSGQSEPLSIRVGLNTGEPIREDGDLFGTPVVVAARVADLARGGHILVTDVVRQLSAGKGFEFTSIATATLHGLSEPTALFEVDWRMSAKAAESLP